MKRYGLMEATEFTKRQINVLYALGKKKELRISGYLIHEMYDIADFYGIDYGNAIEFHESKILDILDAVFGKDLEKAQELIDDYQAFRIDCMSEKDMKKLNLNEI